jgi:hypothetical protein
MYWLLWYQPRDTTALSLPPSGNGLGRSGVARKVPKSKDEAERGTSPAKFAATAPLTLDQSFTLPTIATMQHTLGGIEKQVESLDRKVDKMSNDVEKHGRWLFAANAILPIAIGIMGFIAKMVWDIVKAKLAIP